MSVRALCTSPHAKAAKCQAISGETALQINRGSLWQATLRDRLQGLRKSGATLVRSEIPEMLFSNEKTEERGSKES